MLSFDLLIIFGLLALLCSFLLIVSRNPIHSILYLILVFCNVSFIFIILNIEFIALTFLIVYVGAISVLFLFVIMMLNIKVIELDEVFWRYIPLGCIIAFLFLAEICYLLFGFINFPIVDSYDHYSIKKVITEIYSWFLRVHPLLGVEPKFYIFIKENVPNGYLLGFNQHITQTELLGWYIYTYNFYLFFVLGLILLISMIGSIILVLNQNVNVRRQLVFRQVLKNLKASVVLKQ
jgi:NADH-quinone oxidoreductase subunit J